jgi:hypothetical protein
MAPDRHRKYGREERADDDDGGIWWPIPMRRAYLWKPINRIMIIYRYGINSKSDSGDRYYRYKSCRACCCDLYPQPVWVVWESGINNAVILNQFL